jgi:hypothetical protein
VALAGKADPFASLRMTDLFYAHRFSLGRSGKADPFAALRMTRVGRGDFSSHPGRKRLDPDGAPGGMVDARRRVRRFDVGLGDL